MTLRNVYNMIILLTAGRARHKRLLKVKAPREWAFSSVGRASPLQGEGQKFESSNAHHLRGFQTLFFNAYTYVPIVYPF